MLAFALLMMPVVSMAEDVVIRTNYTPYEDTWEAFKEQFGRNYSAEEESLRYQKFLSNVQMFERHNQDFLDNKVSFSMDITQFADQLDEEWNSCGRDEDTTAQEWQTPFFSRYTPPSNYEPHFRIDWRSAGIVTPVLDQGRCGSCYSFATATTIAAQLKWHFGGALTPMSEQQIVDCFTKSCQGNNAFRVFKYINSTGGIMPYRKYPYRSQTQHNGRVGSCQFSTREVAARVDGCLYSTNDEGLTEDMVSAVGPVYIRFYVLSSFYHYRSGVYSVQGCNPSSNHYAGLHAMTVVGYRHDSGHPPVWIVKNSWGKRWGNSGYVLVEKGKNMCGIANFAAAPVVTPPDGLPPTQVSDTCSKAASRTHGWYGLLTTILVFFAMCSAAD